MKDLKLWRFPDKPNRISKEYLRKLDVQGGYIASLKKDGYRCVMQRDEKDVRFLSRRELAKGGPTDHPVSPFIRTEAKKFFEQNELPVGTRLDTEWLARRTGGEESIVVFGILTLGEKWIGTKTEQERWDIVSKFRPTDHIKIVEVVTENYTAFMEAHEKDEDSEGIVLKHKLSRLIGNTTKCPDNPLWFKCKWRDGPDGHSVTF
jgi:ATP-dependent DNA ligase